MKIVTASNGKKTLKLSKVDWQRIGQNAGWEEQKALNWKKLKEQKALNWENIKEPKTVEEMREEIFFLNGLIVEYKETMEKLKQDLYAEKIEERKFNMESRFLSRQIQGMESDIRDYKQKIQDIRNPPTEPHNVQ